MTTSSTVDNALTTLAAAHGAFEAARATLNDALDALGDARAAYDAAVRDARAAYDAIRALEEADKVASQDLVALIQQAIRDEAQMESKEAP